jgi:hypothetical protein
MSETDNPTENQPTTGSGPNNTADLPDWARKALSEANQEAATYRVKAKTAAEEARAAVTAEFTEQLQSVSAEKSAIVAERDTNATNYEKLVVALAAGVPGESAVKFAALLQGKDKAEMTSHAEELKSMFGTPSRTMPVDPTHGAQGTGEVEADAFAALIQSHLSPR